MTQIDGRADREKGGNLAGCESLKAVGGRQVGSGVGPGHPVDLYMGMGIRSPQLTDNDGWDDRGHPIKRFNVIWPLACTGFCTPLRGRIQL